MPSKSGSGEKATASAAVTWASRPPPSSRAMSPVTKMTTACAMTEKSAQPDQGEAEEARGRCVRQME